MAFEGSCIPREDASVNLIASKNQRYIQEALSDCGQVHVQVHILTESDRNLALDCDFADVGIKALGNWCYHRLGFALSTALTHARFGFDWD